MNIQISMNTKIFHKRMNDMRVTIIAEIRSGRRFADAIVTGTDGEVVDSIKRNCPTTWTTDKFIKKIMVIAKARNNCGMAS